MSNIISIDELRKQFLSDLDNQDWKSFADAQNKVIQQYEKEYKALKEKTRQLEQILLSKSSNLIMQISPEEDICIRQIDKLQQKSSERELNLEEVKRLDLLVKNLKLIREESTIVINNKNNGDAITEAELVAIARSEETNSETD